MKTLICAGGSGTRVLEAVLHLCAAGLGPANLRTFVIDPDDANGNVGKTRQLVNRYQACQAAFHSAQAIARSSAETDSPAPFFNTKLDLLNGSQGLKVWRPVNPNQQFKDVLNFTGLSPAQKDVVRLFLTEEELEMEMKVGFLGHPALGAAALSLLPLYRDDELWTQFAQSLQQDLSQGETKVVIVGSVFGGTGASAIHPVVRYLRELPEQNRNQLKIAAVALVPYFSFSAAEMGHQDGEHAATAAQSEWFPLASRAAAEYYRHLQEHNGWSFDAMYWLGDDSPMKVAYSTGGPLQSNPAHFVDLLAAFACLDFLTQTPDARTCYYAGPQESRPAGQNVLCWEDIPMSALDRKKVQKALHEFQLVAAAHLAFYEPLLKSRQLSRFPHCVPWYLDRFTGEKEAFQSEQNQKDLDTLTAYFRENYFPWCHEIHSASGERVRLFNKMAWIDESGQPVNIRGNRLGNLLYPDDADKHGLDGIDALFSEMDKASRNAAGTNSLSKLYFSMLSQAAHAFVQKQRTGTGLAEDSTP